MDTLSPMLFRNRINLNEVDLFTAVCVIFVRNGNEPLYAREILQILKAVPNVDKSERLTCDLSVSELVDLVIRKRKIPPAIRKARGLAAIRKVLRRNRFEPVGDGYGRNMYRLRF